MHLFEIAIQRGTAGRWPVVVQHTVPGILLPVRTEGTLAFDLEELKAMILLKPCEFEQVRDAILYLS